MFGHVHKLPLETRECTANKDETHTHLRDGNICINILFQQTIKITLCHVKRQVSSMMLKAEVMMGKILR